MPPAASAAIQPHARRPQHPAVLPFEKCEHGHNHEQGFQTFTQQNGQCPMNAAKASLSEGASFICFIQQAAQTLLCRLHIGRSAIGYQAR
jgi:hypothetical protein